MRRALATGAVLSGMLALLAPATAVAAFPGSNGRIAYAVQTGPGGSSNLFSILPDGLGAQQLTDDPAIDSEPFWSPDGRRLVFTRLPDGATRRQIFTISAERGDLTQVVDNVPYTAPSFSPSGGRILYTTGDSIRTIRVDGTRPRRVLRAGDGFLGWAQYSPRGRRIAFAGTPDGKKRAGIWSIRPDGSRLRRLTNPGKSAPALSDAFPDYSPDGRHIVSSAPESVPEST